MAIEIVMPKLGLTMTEGQIDQWLVKKGDSVSSGQAIVEISSEKLTGTVEAPSEGIILDIVHDVGETVPCKQVIAWLGQPGEKFEPSERNNVESTTETVEKESSQTNDSESNMDSVTRDKDRIFITPLARKIAKERGIDFQTIKGSGGNGRITRRDVENYVPVVEVTPIMEQTVSRGSNPTDFGAGLTGMRKTIANRMMNSLAQSAQVTLHRKADISRLMAFREEAKMNSKWPLETGAISLTTLVVKAVAKALKKHPEVNAWYGAGQYQMVEQVNIGIATALSDGLVVPVIEGVDKLSLSYLGAAIKDSTTAARKGTLETSAYSGSTFTITNLGGQGVEYFTPILNSPEVAILGLGALQTGYFLTKDGQVVEKKELPLSLTFDHQVLDGLPAAEFLATLTEILEDPYQLVF